MTPEAIKEQIETIDSVTKELLKSKEASLEFLRKAGILDILDDDNECETEEPKEKK